MSAAAYFEFGEEPTAAVDSFLDRSGGSSKGDAQRRRWAAAVLGGLAALLFVGVVINNHATPTTTLFGPSGESCVGSKAAVLDVDELREAAKAFVDTLGDDIRPQAYYPDAALQTKQWQICTIVQQCLVPKYGLPVGRLAPISRTRFYDMLAVILSDESYKHIITQQLSNLLLGEMQNWAVECPGRCEEMDDPSGLLPSHLLLGAELKSHTLPLNFSECGALQAAKRHTFWRCDVSPRMLHHGNIDTTSGRYYLGNVFLEPTIHARNRYFDYVSVYGSLEPGEPFGFRYTGHHFDLSFQISADGELTDLPTFLGHNPLIVPRVSPPLSVDIGTDGDEDYVQWHNMAGIPQFPDAVRVILRATAVLQDSGGFVPLDRWESTPSTGGLTRKDGKTIADTPHVDLSTVSDADFEALWAVIDYTLEFSRGARARPEKAQFRKSGKLCWTTVTHPGESATHHLPKTVAALVNARQFFYLEAQTDELLYFGMVNSLFSLMLDSEPSNHLHSILIPKSYLAKM